VTAASKTVPALPAPSTAAAVKARVLAVAASQIGYREGQDSDGYNNDNAFGVWYGYNRVSWCAQFVSWCASKAGVLDVAIPKHQYTPTGWNWFVAHNEDVTTPQAGDVMYVYGPVSGEKNPRVHHVGFVEKVLSGGRIQTIEGNTNTSGSSQGNGVYRLVRTVSSRLKFARPNYAAAVVAPKPSKGGGSTAKPPTAPSQETDMALTPEEIQSIADRVLNTPLTSEGLTLRACAINSNWLAIEHGVGHTFQKLHASWKAEGTKGPLAQQLQRIEDDTDNPTPAGA
jgi:CHAP domain-containing protein